MKKVIIPFVFMFVSIQIFGQILPNYNFNSWVDYGLFMDPESWSTPNKNLVLTNKVTVSRSDDAFSGNYSAKLETKNVADNINIPGVLTLAEINVNLLEQSYSIDGGLPLNENVSKFTGMYKYAGVDNDSAMVLIYNFRRNTEGEMDTIGYGINHLHNADVWTPFTVYMDNLNYHVPDTFNVIILSSSMELKAGSVLYVDNLAIETNTGIINLDNEKVDIKVFPNPTKDIVSFASANYSKNRIVVIYNLLGNEIARNRFDEVKTDISLIDFSSGIYTYQIIESSKVLATGSFIKN